MWSKEGQDPSWACLKLPPREMRGCWGSQGHTMEPPLELPQDATREESVWGPGRTLNRNTKEPEPQKSQQCPSTEEAQATDWACRVVLVMSGEGSRLPQAQCPPL